MPAYDLAASTPRAARLPAVRLGAAARIALDRVNPRVAAYAITIFAFSALDATLTLLLVGLGYAHEANPLMRALLEWDVQLFVNVKLVVTGAALIFLCACSGRVVFHRFRVVQLLAALVGCYAILIAYEVCMLLLGLFG